MEDGMESNPLMLQDREIRLVVIGASLGGFEALCKLLGKLPKDFRAPIVIVQHRSRNDGGRLLQALAGCSAIPVLEPEDKEPLAPGTAYLAPADYHTLVEDRHISLSTDPPVAYARPSVDVLFESAAEAYGPCVMSIVLTGSSNDGAYGAALVKRLGGVVVVEEPATARSGHAPAAVLARTTVDFILPLPQIAMLLSSLQQSRTASGTSEVAHEL